MTRFIGYFVVAIFIVFICIYVTRLFLRYGKNRNKNNILVEKENKSLYKEKLIQNYFDNLLKNSRFEKIFFNFSYLFFSYLFSRGLLLSGEVFNNQIILISSLYIYSCFYRGTKLYNYNLFRAPLIQTLLYFKKAV